MKTALRNAVIDAIGSIGLSLEELPEFMVEVPRDPSHGDLATNIAMILAGRLKQNPRQIAEQIKGALEAKKELFSTVEVAGPGFLNVRFQPQFLYQKFHQVWEGKETFGKTEKRDGKRVLIEFVSANPTGPLTVGHGRNAVLGDTLARLLEWTGAKVDREYYFNNAGRQMRVLGQSVQSRYAALCGKEIPFPEGGYEGGYIQEIAKSLYDQHGDSLLEPNETPFKEAAEKAIFEEILKTLERMNIVMDSFFNEHTLYEDGSIDRVVEGLRKKELVYDQDGAVWFKTSEMGKEKDTVLIKSTGEPTYRLPDIAYHLQKLERGYDVCLDVFGADHIDTYPDVLRGVEALGGDASRIDVLVYQFVTLIRDGKPFKMSTRKANYVTLDELMDEVGSDVTRFFFIMRAPGTHLEFDLDQARETGEKNPVFYLQYAHARIRSILRKVEGLEGLSPEWSQLEHPAELGLIRKIFEFPDAIEAAAASKEPQKCILFLQELASSFTSFYHDCRILGEAEERMKARAALAETTATVLKNGLGILGISAPESM